MVERCLSCQHDRASSVVITFGMARFTNDLPIGRNFNNQYVWLVVLVPSNDCEAISGTLSNFYGASVP
jgi:hypothetical protein